MKTFYRLPGAALLVLAILLGACSTPAQTPLATLAAATPRSLDAPTGSPTGTAAVPSPVGPPVPTPTAVPGYSLGEVFKGKTLSVAVVSVAAATDQIQVTLAAKNNSSAVTAGSPYKFSAVDSKGITLKPAGCVLNPADPRDDPQAVPAFNGTLQPGELLKGVLCWTTTPQNSGIQVRYTEVDEMPASAVFNVLNPGLAKIPPELAADDSTVSAHAQGEAVSLKDLTVTFNGITRQDLPDANNKLVLASYTFQNNGTAAYPLPGAPENSFDLKSGDGYAYPPVSTRPGCMNTAASVVDPGKTLTLTICYVTPSLAINPAIQVRFFGPTPVDITTWAVK